jgi:hypothetical protein
MSNPPHSLTAAVAGFAAPSVKLFVSYSHRDPEWLKRLIPVLESIRNDPCWGETPTLQYVAWHDEQLSCGAPWDPEIRRALDEMDVFVPLVSTHFFGSRYIRDVELKRAKERFDADEIQVVPVVLCEVNLEKKCPFLAQFPILPARGRCWCSYTPRSRAHGLLEDGLWQAIDLALKRE